MRSIGVVELLIIVVVACFCGIQGKIFRKAGYSPWLCLLIAIPLVNLALMVWFAYSDWPALRQKASSGSAPAKQQGN
jgi:hypothetical protein